jgi:hypothetical protein
MVNHSVQPDTFTLIDLYVELKTRWNTPNEDCAIGSRGYEIQTHMLSELTSLRIKKWCRGDR